MTTEIGAYDRTAKCPNCEIKVRVPGMASASNRVPLFCSVCKTTFYYQHDGGRPRGIGASPGDRPVAVQEARTVQGRAPDTSPTRQPPRSVAVTPPVESPPAQASEESPPAEGTGPEPVAAPEYGPPWKRHLEGMKEDRLRLGTEAAAELWGSRRMSRQVFSRLLGLARERAGARPESPQAAREGPLVAPTPLPSSSAPAPPPAKLAPADGGAVKGRPGRPQRWPREEISQDIAALGGKAAQEKWIAKGMSLGFWYKMAARITASSTSGGQSPSPQERAGGPAKIRRMSALYKAAALEAVGEAERARNVLGFGPMHSGHEGWAVILEEMDELGAEWARFVLGFGLMKPAHKGHNVIRERLDKLWEEVKKKPRSSENLAAMRKEAVQVAAMAIAFMVEVCDAPVS